MQKKQLILFCILLAVICFTVLIVSGQTYTLQLDPQQYSIGEPLTAEDITVEFTDAEPSVALIQNETKDGQILLKFHAIHRGKSSVTLSNQGNEIIYFSLYVHPVGVITYQSYFGDSTGNFIIPLSTILWFAAILSWLMHKLRENMKRSIYQYSNVMLVGLIVFLGFCLLNQIPFLFRYDGPLDSFEKGISSIHSFSFITFPAAFVLSILMTISNISLLRREGKSWRNLLGVFLSVVLCGLTLLPELSGEFLQRSTLVDVHNEGGVALYIELFLEAFVSSLVSYLECLLIGSIIFSLKAARHMPAFDQDYMLILGCKIRQDGSLTPLLQGRADAALSFAKKQGEATGKALTFVPSGGQGADESMPEAEAIRRYLLDAGIPEDRILPETASSDTEENIRNSMALIRAHAKLETPKVAFSTTNYHVFRSGLIAFEQGETLEGIGAPTKRYFWINAFIREMIATLVSERKKHVIVLLAVNLFVLIMTIMKYLSVIL